jgi:hypothetical protein
VGLLLGHGANVQQPKSTGATPLWLACQDGNSAVLELLLEHRANVHSQNTAGVAPLHVASQGGHAECVRMLLIAGAQTDGRSSQGNTPLSLARANGRTDVVELLLNPPPVDPALAQPAIKTAPGNGAEEGVPPARDPMEVAAAMIVLEKTRALVALGVAPEHASVALAASGGDSARAAEMLGVAAKRTAGAPHERLGGGAEAGGGGGPTIDEID